MYTHARPLHRNPLLGTLQLFAWIFLHPSAWQAWVRGVDAALPADFSLTHLSAAHFRHPAMRSVLLRGHLLGPLLVGLFLVVELLLLGTDSRDIAIRVCACVLFSVGGGLVSGAGTNAAVGMAVGVIGGLCGCLAYGQKFLFDRQPDTRFVGDMSTVVADYVRGGGPGSIAMAVGLGVTAGVIFASVGGVSVRPPVSVRERRPGAWTERRNIGGFLIGLVVGGLGFAVAVLSATRLPFLTAVALTGFLVGGFAALQLTRRIGRSLIYGLLCGLGNYVSIRFLLPVLHDIVVVGIIVGALLSAWFANFYLWAARIGGRVAGAVAGSLGLCGGWVLIVSSAFASPFSVSTQVSYGLASGLLGMLLALSQNIWRPLLFYPFEEAWNLVLLRIDQHSLAEKAKERRSLLRYHAAFFDELQPWPLHGLDVHLLLVLAHRPDEGRAALSALSATPQRWAAQAAQLELDANKLEQCQDVASIAALPAGLGELEGPASAVLRSFSRISQDVAAALSQGTAHNQRLGLVAVSQKVETLRAELSRSSDPHAERFRPIAEHFRRLIDERSKALVQAAELAQEIDNPYVIGVPLTVQQEIFVGRTDVSARIEQLLLDRRRPPLLLYGQRRMGKTSLLNNLGRLLPTALVPLFVDLQGPASAASDHAGLLYNLGRGMLDSALRQRRLRLPPLSRESLVQDPFTRFDEWLDEVDALLAQSGATALLLLDELEALERALAEGRFSEAAVLGMLRHLIQHRLRFKVLLASSHSLEELGRFASYLINVQIVHLGYLSPEETLRLVERPVPDMLLRYEPQAAARVVELSRGHPFLVQLLCSEIVSLKNEQPPDRAGRPGRRLATVLDIESAVLPSIESGSFFFADIERNQIGAQAAEVLRHLAQKGAAAVADEAALQAEFPRLSSEKMSEILRQLLRRDLIEQAAGGYRFQVELIRRYFAR
jgi:hypothetical protein